MGFISVLKKVGMGFRVAGAMGTDIMGLPFVSGIIAPNTRAAGIIQRTLGSLDDLAGIIGTVEAMGAITGATGAQKLEMAGPLVEKALIQWGNSQLPGHELKDKVRAAAAAKRIAGDLADFLNCWG